MNAYRAILNQGATAYSRVIRHILDNPPPGNGMIVHCTAGKDRTGVFCALLLSLCGVDDDVVAKEYSLTELGLSDWMDQLVQRIIRQTGSDEESARRIAGARAESMLATLKMLRSEYDGAEGYFTKICGLSKEDLQKIRDYLIVDDA